MYDLLTIELGITDVENYLSLFGYNTNKIRKRVLECKALGLDLREEENRCYIDCSEMTYKTKIDDLKNKNK